MKPITGQPTVSITEKHTPHNENVTYGIARLSKLLTPDKLQQFSNLSAEDLKVFINFCLIPPREGMATYGDGSLDIDLILAQGYSLRDGNKLPDQDADYHGVPQGVSLQDALVRLKQIDLNDFDQFINSLDQNKQIRHGFDGNPVETGLNFVQLVDVLDELQ